MCDPHESSAETAAAVQAVAGVLQTLAALEAGSIPRSRLFLKEAVSVLRRAGRTADACLGYRALAHLELRRGHGALAVRAARSALRLARDTGIPADQDAASSLLATVLHSAGAAGEAADAARDWLFRTRSQGDLATEQSALLLVAVAAWDDGRPAEALGAAEEAVQLVTGQGIDRFRADLILAGLLSRAGCVRYGAGSLGRILKRNPPPRDEYLCRLERGWTRMGGGQPDLAARDFRRALRLAKEWPDRRPSLRAAASVALADTKRLTGARADAARASLDRNHRRSLRLRDPALVSEVEQMQAAADLPWPPPCPDRALLARQFRELAFHHPSLALAEACIHEVEQLRTEIQARYCPELYLPPALR